jgi:sulfate transport system ATP-binding protein
VGFVFQHYALFRHMTVADNVAFGLTVKPRAQRPSASRIQEKVRELLTLVQLQAMADRYPSQLSGGQRQRVALARALAVEPKLLLLDEPFGALDAKVRKELRRWLRRLHDELHITGILVTHDQEEALEVADRVVVMHQGTIEQIGTPDEVYENPATPFVYQFLGDVNVFHGRVSHGRVGNAEHHLASSEKENLSDEQEVTFVRPHDLELSPSRTMPEQLEATVQFVNGAGARVHVELESKESPGLIAVELTKERYRSNCMYSKCRAQVREMMPITLVGGNNPPGSSKWRFYMNAMSRVMAILVFAVAGLIGTAHEGRSAARSRSAGRHEYHRHP